jgi:hypothetical protein
MMNSDFQNVKHKLIQMSIDFRINDIEPRFEILGKQFTTAELMDLNRKRRLTNLDLPEIARLK